MQASPDELVLLVKTWAKDSTKVCVVGSHNPKIGFNSSFKLTGTVTMDSTNAIFKIEDASAGSITCTIPDSGISFKTSIDFDPLSLISKMGIDPSVVDEIVFLRNPDMSAVVLFSFIPD
jgi:hypothetical protein